VGQPNKHCIMVKSMNGLTQEDKKFEKREALALKTLKEMSSLIMICLVKTLETYSMKNKNLRAESISTISENDGRGFYRK
jgi:hypothetical protein